MSVQRRAPSPSEPARFQLPAQNSVLRIENEPTKQNYEEDVVNMDESEPEPEHDQNMMKVA